MLEESAGQQRQQMLTADDMGLPEEACIIQGIGSTEARGGQALSK